MTDKANRERAKGEWDRVEALLTVARKCFDLVTQAKVGVATTAQDCRALTSAGVEAMKMAEVLTGGVSDRVAGQSSAASEEAAKALEAIERRLRAVPKGPSTDAA